MVPLGEKTGRFWSLRLGEWQAGFIVQLMVTFPIPLCKIEVFIILKKNDYFKISILLIWLHWGQHAGLVAPGHVGS